MELQMTHKLYWEDSRLITFRATVVACQSGAGRTAIVLDQTAFYPTGGGQPCDIGRLGPHQVDEVTIDDQERILHWIDGATTLNPGETITGEIDWARRREMLQQHTAQHILSQAFFQLFGAETAGFRITDRSTEIDLTLDATPDQLPQMIREAEALANSIVFDNRPVRQHQLTPAEAAKLPLRKESFVTDCVRVVEIADFDWSPCGGTHATMTGEVGLIVVRTSERAKRMVRIHFLAGVRALADYRIGNDINDTLARRLSVGREELDSAIERLQSESKRLLRRNRELGQIAAEVEAAQLLSAVTMSSAGVRLVTSVFDDRDFDELKLLAHQLVAAHGVLALLATRQDSTVRLVFARSGDLLCDVNQMMKQAVERLGGRGGGRPDFAQGGGDDIPDLPGFLESLANFDLPASA